MKDNVMWMRKSPVEVSSENKSKLLYDTCLDILLAVSLWYVLVQFSAFLGLPYRATASFGIACGVAAIVLPASWFTSHKGWHRRENTMVCDRCNALKVGDNQPECSCGGRYLSLSEMKWINVRSDGQTSMKPESHILAPSIHWRKIQKRQLQDASEVVS